MPQENFVFGNTYNLTLNKLSRWDYKLSKKD